MTVVTEFPDAADAPLPPQATHPMEEFREAPEEPMAAAPVAAEEAPTPAVTEAEETPHQQLQKSLSLFTGQLN